MGTASVTLTDEALELAALICTSKQMEVLKLRQEGYGLRPIARMLMITPAAVKSRLDGADLRIAKALLEPRESEGDADDDAVPDNPAPGAGLPA